MRLTLRTLLAYLDDILDPVQSARIGQRIAKSPTAQQLIQRINRVLRRRRLRTPSPDPRRANIDANDLAAYLDDRLEKEKVIKVEMTCLRSGTNLAELTALHQILNPPQVEPIRIPSRAYDRMIALIGNELPPAEPKAPVALTEVEAAIGPDDQAVEPMVADKPSRRYSPWWVTAAAVLLFGLLFGVAHFANRSSSPTGVPVASNVRPSNDPQVASSPDSPNAESPNPDSLPSGAAADAEQAAAKPAEVPATEEKPAAATKLVQPEAKAADEAPVANAAAPTEPAPPKPVPNPAPVLTDTKQPAEEKVAPAAAVPAESAEAIASNVPAKPTPPADPIDPQSVPLATVSSRTAVLLKRRANALEYVDAKNMLRSGEELYSLTDGNAVLDLPAGGSVELVGEARLRFDFDPSFDLSLVAYRANLLLRNATEPAVFLLTWQKLPIVIRLKTSQGLVACETAFDPRTNVPQLLVYAVRGDVEVQRDEQTQSLTGGNELSILAKGALSPVRPTDVVAAWLAPRQVDAEEQAAFERFAEALPPNANEIAVALRELTSNRTREVRRLAIRGQGVLGEYAGVVEALTSKQRDARVAAIETLRGTLLCSPGEGELVHEALMAFHEEPDADAAHLMLIGLSEAERKEPSNFDDLLRYLGSESLSLRELADYSLRLIAGRDVGYQADAPLARRQSAIKNWERWVNQRPEE